MRGNASPKRPPKAFVHRSPGSSTCESAEIIRPFEEESGIDGQYCCALDEYTLEHEAWHRALHQLRIAHAGPRASSRNASASAVNWDVKLSRRCGAPG